MTTALKGFQQDVVDGLADCVAATTEAMAAAPGDRGKLARRMGAALLEAPTGSGKTLMLARAVEAATGRTPGPMIWLWITPFTGIVAQTIETLRAETAALRVCDLQAERDPAARRDGDVYVFTWAAVSARNQEGRRARSEGEAAPSIDSLLAALREAGWYIGAVIDEAHVNLGQNAAQAMAFLREAVQPDVALLATATPNDARLDHFRAQMGIERINRFSVARQDAVDARLNKRSVKAVTFRPREEDRDLFDFDEVAIQSALMRHQILKSRLAERGVSLTPLLLVQVESTEGSEQAAKRMLLQAGLAEEAIAVHTAKEPDPAIHTLAYDETKEALIFKLAVATGFDAPRAWSLVSLRRARGAEFGLQIIGRIMRVHRRLQDPSFDDPMLDCGYVFLAAPDLQIGLTQAADRLQALRRDIRLVTDSVTIVQVAGGTVAITDPDGGFGEILEAPAGDAPPAGPYRDAFTLAIESAAETGAEGGEEGEDGEDGAEALERRRRAVAFQIAAQQQLDFLDDAAAGAGGASGAAPAGARPGTGGRLRSGMRHAPLRDDIDFPRVFQTECMPTDAADLAERIANLIAFDDSILTLLQRDGGRVDVVTEDVFDHSREREATRFAFSAQRLQLQARRVLAFNDSLDERALKAALVRRLERELDRRDMPRPETPGPLRRTVDLALARRPFLLKDACKRALAQAAQLEQAAPLPETLLVPEDHPPARKGVYGVMPMDFDTSWERRFAELLDDDDSGVVSWWHRNPDRKPHSVAIVRPNGRRFFPDFLVGVNVTGDVRPKLAEVKRDIASDDTLDKHRSDHRAYGQALIVIWNEVEERWYEVALHAGRLQMSDPFDLARLQQA